MTDPKQRTAPNPLQVLLTNAAKVGKAEKAKGVASKPARVACTAIPSFKHLQPNGGGVSDREAVRAAHLIDRREAATQPGSVQPEADAGDLARRLANAKRKLANGAPPAAAGTLADRMAAAKRKAGRA